MDYRKIMQISGELKCDLVETSLAKALIYQEAGLCKLDKHRSLVHVQSDIGMDWVIPRLLDRVMVIKRVSALSEKGDDILVPTSLVDTRWIPTQRYFTFIGNTTKMAAKSSIPEYAVYNRGSDKYRLIQMYGAESYDQDSIMQLYKNHSGYSLLRQPEAGAALETLILQRPWFADIIHLKGLILQEAKEDSWKNIGCIIAAQISPKRWGVLYRFALNSTMEVSLTAQAARLYFTPEYDDGCSWNDRSLHLFKSLLTAKMLPLYEAPRQEKV